MLFAAFKVLLSGTVISLASWLAGKKPELAGFLIALPLMSILALPFAYAQYHDPAAAVRFARGIFVGIPVSLLFFVPFLLADRLNWNFWGLYIAGLVLLTAGYFLHRLILTPGA